MPTEPSLLLIPPVVLTAAGFLLVTRVGAPEEVQQSGPLGGTVAVGYASATVAALALFRWRQTGSMLNTSTSSTTFTYGPDPLFAVAAMGLAYPLLFGALGGYLAFRRAGSDAPSFDDGPERR